MILLNSSQYDEQSFLASPDSVPSSVQPQPASKWPTFEQILQRLHRKGIYLHPHQLAEFFLAHGLPVNLRYVPEHLRQRAILVNENYQGDMALLVEETDQPSWDLSW